MSQGHIQAGGPGGSCPRCGEAHPRCSAHNRAGRPCGLNPLKGQSVCDRHGGKSPQALAKGRERALRAEALTDLSRLGVSIDTPPEDALEAMVHEAAGNVAVLRAMVQELPRHPVVELDEPCEEMEGQPHGGALKRRHADGARVVRTGLYGPDHNGDGKPHVLVAMYDAERDRLARLSVDAIKLGLDERRTRVAESQMERLFRAFTEATASPDVGLSPHQLEALKVAFARGLRGGGPALAAG